MYLKTLYKKNRFWFAIVVLFAFGQVFINYKNGVMCSPFYNYDMYAYATYPKPFYEVVQIQINGEPLQPARFAPREWDNLVQPLLQWQEQKSWNPFLFATEVQKFLPVQNAGVYVNATPDATFWRRYRQQVLRIAQVQDTHAVVTVSRDTFLLAQRYALFK